MQRIVAAGHFVAERSIVTDDIEAIRARVKGWIADPVIDVIITTGGTGFTGRDVTPEAVEPLFEKKMDAFSALFLVVSFPKIGTSAIQSRATAGVAGATYIFCLPGSPGACKDAWDEILVHQLENSRPFARRGRAIARPLSSISSCPIPCRAISHGGANSVAADLISQALEKRRRLAAKRRDPAERHARDRRCRAVAVRRDATDFPLAALAGLARTLFSDYRRLRARIGLTHYSEAAMMEKLKAAGFIAQHARRRTSGTIRRAWHSSPGRAERRAA